MPIDSRGCAVLQIVSVLYWYSEKSKEHGLKLDLIKVPLLQWGAFFLLVFLGQVCSVQRQHYDVETELACTLKCSEHSSFRQLLQALQCILCRDVIKQESQCCGIHTASQMKCEQISLHI